MKFSPRRVALAAVIASSVSAAAQTDASFAAALGKLPSGLAIMAQLKTEPQKPADVKAGPVAPGDAWQKLVGRVYKTGKKAALPDPPGFSYTLRENYATRKARKITQTLMLLGAPLADGTFQIFAVQFYHVAEIYDPATDTATTYLSAYQADGFGRLEQAVRRMEVKAPGAGRVIGADQDLDVAGEECKAEFEEFIRWWTHD